MPSSGAGATGIACADARLSVANKTAARMLFMDVLRLMRPRALTFESNRGALEATKHRVQETFKTNRKMNFYSGLGEGAASHLEAHDLLLLLAQSFDAERDRVAGF